MPNFSKNKVILIKYPFTHLAGAKVRPAVIISKTNRDDVFIVPLTSRTANINKAEFILLDWENEGLNVETAVKQGIYTISPEFILKEIGFLSKRDFEKLKSVIIDWLNLK